LSDNVVFAVGANPNENWDAEFEITNPGDRPAEIHVGWPYCCVCPLNCPDPSVLVHVQRDAAATTAASSFIGFFPGPFFYYVNALEPAISDVPQTRAWLYDVDAPDARVEIPLTTYWTIRTMQPPLAGGANGPQPSLVFPARRGAGLRTELVLAVIETSWGEIYARLEALDRNGDVIAGTDVTLRPERPLLLDHVLSDLQIFGDFDGYLRVKRVSREDLFWGVAQIYENDVLTRLMPPGSELESPGPCAGGPARCNPHRATRTVTRQPEAPAPPERARDP
jgi:hypothetical protein